MATMLAAEPQLFMSDLAAALDFFVEKLGFAVRFTYGVPPFYAQVARDGAGLNLRKVTGPVFDAAFRVREGDILSATVTVEGGGGLVRRLSVATRAVPPASAHRTMGRAQLHCRGTRGESDRVCGVRKTQRRGGKFRIPRRENGKLSFNLTTLGRDR